ncbi:MAG: hypothetical protein WAW13_01160 [Minisyncoccia bacterium]
MNPGSVAPGIIRCVPVDDGYVDAMFELQGSRSVAQLEALRTRLLAQSDSILDEDFDVCATLSGSAKKPVLTFSLRFHSMMSQEAQLERLNAFESALAPLVAVKGFDVSLLAGHSTIH